MQDKYIQQLQTLILDFLAKYNMCVYLYGSRAKGTARKTSDVDIAVLPMENIPHDLISRLRELIEESTIPYNVDVTNLREVNNDLHQQILAKAILWKDCNKE